MVGVVKMVRLNKTQGVMGEIRAAQRISRELRNPDVLKLVLDIMIKDPIFYHAFRKAVASKEVR